MTRNGNPDHAPDLRLLDLKHVAETVGLSPRTVERLALAGRFPAPVYPSPRRRRWKSTDVREWMLGLAARASA